MKYVLSSLIAVSAVLAAPVASAEVDGATIAKRTCFSCHNFTDEKRTKTGPNLHGVVGMTPATQENFPRYSKYLTKIGADGAVWTDELLTEYISDPSAFLKEKSGDDKARSTMVFKKLSDEEVTAVVEYLNTLK